MGFDGFEAQFPGLEWFEKAYDTVLAVGTSMTDDLLAFYRDLAQSLSPFTDPR
jgi:hypothetical protein